MLKKVKPYIKKVLKATLLNSYNFIVNLCWEFFVMLYMCLHHEREVEYRKNLDVSQFVKAETCTLSFEILVMTEKTKTEINIETLDGFPVDALFAPNRWERVVVQADVYSLKNEKCCLLVLNEKEDEQVEIKNINVSKPLGNLFDGGRLYQLPPAYAQSMGYVYLTKKNKVVVVDGGGEKDKDELTAVVSKFSNEIEHLFVTHYHSDHICALIELFKEDKIKVKNLYFDFPPEEIFLTVKGDGDNHLVKEFIDVIPQGVNVIRPSRGYFVKIDELTVTALNDACFDDGPNFCNDSGIIYKFDTGKSKILFIGDVGAKGDDYITDEWFCKEIEDCNVVQMAHHGQNGVSKEFYDKIKKIDLCLYPAPWWLYNGWGTPKTRAWMRAKGVLRSCPCIPPITIEIK